MRMNTIIVSVSEAARDLSGIVRRVVRGGGRAILTDAGKPLVEVTPVTPDDTIENFESLSPRNAGEFPVIDPLHELGGTVPETRNGKAEGGEVLETSPPFPRVGYSDLTDLPFFRPPPGAPRVTTEEVLRLLEDFP